MCMLYADEIPDDVTDEYIDEYNESEAKDYGISYEEYAEQRCMEDYGLTEEEMDSGDRDDF